MRAALLLALVAVPVAVPAGAHAQFESIEAWAATAATMSMPRWAGQRVPAPEVSPRPEEPGFVRGHDVELVAVHAAAGGDEAAAVALDALALGAEALRRAGWGAPAPDGGRGGTVGFDLYLLAGTDGYEARSDGGVLWARLDADSGFAVIDPTLDTQTLASCAVEAYADAVLLATDPAEAPAWRRATAAWLAWSVTGRFGCDDDAVRAAAREPWRAPVPSPSDVASQDGGAGGALFLALLDARESHGTGVFVREAWQFARQLTWEKWSDGLRGSPDLGQTIDLSLHWRREELPDVAADLALLRTTWALDEATLPAVRALPDLGAPRPVRVGTLPGAVPAADPPLDVLGSVCARVDVSTVAEGSRLRVWLEGEYGVEWSLVAARRDAAHHELGRISAPPRRLNPHSYVAVEPLAGAADVLVCAANLGSHTRDVPRPRNALDDGFYDADRDRPETRSARLTFAVAHD